MIDIDHFKLLNDRFGHPAGDACLRAVAQALRRALVRPGDVLARYGGEEFIALLHEADAAGALVVAERLRAAVEALGLEHPDSAARVVTVSIGAASAATLGEGTAASLIAAADASLYEAKCGGRNQVRGFKSPRANSSTAEAQRTQSCAE
jgi:diguanylate cyclase (GGDEF)-like protein